MRNLHFWLLHGIWWVSLPYEHFQYLAPLSDPNSPSLPPFSPLLLTQICFILQCYSNKNQLVICLQHFRKFGTARSLRGLIMRVTVMQVGSEAIYGRNWGCAYSCGVKHLHFELCYYQVRTSNLVLLDSSLLVLHADQHLVLSVHHIGEV